MMFRKLYEYGIRISKIESGPGDIVLICFRGSSTHLGILTDRSVIHADGSFGKVVEHSRNDSMFLGCGRIAAYFRMNGVSKWQE
jgi:cell wall-associated NlpC family hydrolase